MIIHILIDSLSYLSNNQINKYIYTTHNTCLVCTLVSAYLVRLINNPITTKKPPLDGGRMAVEPPLDDGWMTDEMVVCVVK